MIEQPELTPGERAFLAGQRPTRGYSPTGDEQEPETPPSGAGSVSQAPDSPSPDESR